MAVNTGSRAFRIRMDEFDKNIKEVTDELSKAFQRLEVNSVGAVGRWLSEVGEAADEITPIDTTALINSQYIDVQRKGDKIVGEIGYNRYGEAPYAVFVHEIDKNYKTGNPSGQWKYLQTPLMKKKDELLRKIQAKGFK